MKLSCKRIDFTYTPGEEIFNFPEESGLPFLFDVEEELTARILLPWMRWEKCWMRRRNWRKRPKPPSKRHWRTRTAATIAL